MGKKIRLAIVYADEIEDHLRFIEAKYHSLIRAEIDSQLAFEPEIETRNRKPLKRPIAFGATWELRFGPGNRFRVFYQFDAAAGEVRIVAIGVKVRNRLLIGGEEY